MAAQTWSSIQTELVATCVKAQPPYTVLPPDFVQHLPQATSYAEQRIFTDIPFLGHRASNSSLTTTAGSRTVNLSAMTNPLGGPIIVPESFFLIAPAASQPQAGTRVPFIKADPFLIDILWPAESTVVAPAIDFLPRYWALRDASTIIFGPTADGAYTCEIAGLYQPTPISAANPTTYISTTYPALLEAACMVYLAGALKQNFGAQMDDSPQSVSWERIYGELLQSARAEEMRRRGMMPDVPMPPMPAGAPHP